jgi:hypothetical protein
LLGPEAGAILLVGGRMMAKATTMEPTASETAALLAEMEKAFLEMDLLREQMRRDSLEIEHSRARTQTVLEEIARRC